MTDSIQSTDRLSTIEHVSKVTEFNDLSDFMKDEDLDTALAFVVKLIAKPDVPPATVSRLIVQLQALSTKFAIAGRYYESFGTKEDRQKKDIYKSMNHHINELVAALKYYMR